jgi:hypothetical protein
VAFSFNLERMRLPIPLDDVSFGPGFGTVVRVVNENNKPGFEGAGWLEKV